MNGLPLEGVKVIDFSQFLSGPLASLRLADLGAEVIKVEREGVGDICRTMYLSSQTFEGESTLFHSINRNKNSIEINLKNPDHHDIIMKLIADSDVLIQNFRPGVIDKYQLDYGSLRGQFPGLVYGSVSGYGNDPESAFYSVPGQDLLAQSLSGMALELGVGVRPQGLAIADMMAGNHLAEGILAALFKKQLTGKGAQVEVSLLESLIDSMAYQVNEYLNPHLDSDSLKSWVLKIQSNNYVFNITKDRLEAFLHRNCTLFSEVNRENQYLVATTHDPEVEDRLLNELKEIEVDYQIVKNWDYLFNAASNFRDYLTQDIALSNGQILKGTRLPIRFNGHILRSSCPAPRIGEQDTDYGL